MQENDPIEDYSRKAFSDFNPDPPQETWDKIRLVIHPEEVRNGRLAMLKSRLSGLGHSRHLYPLLAAAATIFLIMLIWFSYTNKHSIKGHAYAGEERICRGTAYLFKVYDKAKPIDTIILIQTVPVDNTGYYQFTGIDHGNYMIRVNPAPGTENTQNFIPSFYDQGSVLTEASLVKIENEDPIVDVHLLPK